MNRAVVIAGVSMWVCAVLCASVCSADPAEPADPMAGNQPGEAQNAAAPAQFAAPAVSGNSVSDACKLFNAALSVSAVNYEDFAYATAGNGNYVDYQDQNVARTNVIGRTALRQSAAAALSASRTPALPQEVSDPMQRWSLHATKLLLVMGLHGGGDSLNSNVAELNDDAHQAQLACATAARGPA